MTTAFNVILGHFTQDIFSGTGKGYVKDNPLIWYFRASTEVAVDRIVPGLRLLDKSNSKIDFNDLEIKVNSTF